MPLFFGPLGGGGGAGVASVTATAPLASSGGANPDISLTGIVPAANGGTGLAVPGAAGNVLTSDGLGGWVSLAPGAVTDTFTANCLAGDGVGKSVYITGADVAGVPQVATADCTNLAKMPIVGIIVAKAGATSCTVQRSGRIDVSALGAPLTPGARYFVGSAGQPVTPAPTAAPGGYVILQPLGVATSTAIIEYQPSLTLLRDNA